MPLAFPRSPTPFRHCRKCSDFYMFCTREGLPSDLKAFLTEEWYSHQDSRDDMRCWNAYMSVSDPSQVMELPEGVNDD